MKAITSNHTVFIHSVLMSVCCSSIYSLQPIGNIQHFILLLHSHAIIDGCVTLNTTMICSLFIIFFLYAYKIYCVDPVVLHEIIKISFHLLETRNLSNLKGNLGFLGYHPHILRSLPYQTANRHLTQHRPSPKTKTVIQKPPCVLVI